MAETKLKTIAVPVDLLNEIYKDARDAEGADSMDTAEIHLTRIIRLLEGFANANPGVGLHRRINRREKGETK